MPDNVPTVDFPPEIVDLEYPLKNFRTALAGKGSVRIVAMGSSSTAGRGDVVPFPYRLEMYLRRHFKDEVHRPDIRIDLFNRGIGGQDAPQEVERFATDIFADNPSLVLWQVGTNAVFRKEDFDFDEVVEKIVEGLNLLRGHPAMDVVLMDPQYVTAMLLDDKAELSEKMIAAIRTAAQDAKVSVFQRWALMRHWHVHNNVSFQQLLDRDDDKNLHQSDWSTLQLSIALKDTILKAAAPIA